MVVVNIIILIILLFLAAYCAKLKLQEKSPKEHALSLKEVSLQVG